MRQICSRSRARGRISLRLLATVLMLAFYPSGAALAWEPLVPADVIPGLDIFGQSVSTDADRLIAGSPYHGQLLSSEGAAYIYENDKTGGWRQVAKLLSSDGSPGDSFGTAVALRSDQAMVGAPWKGPFHYGAVYAFERDRLGNWRETQKLTVAPKDQTRFGDVIALDEDRVIIGAYADSELFSHNGAAYIFERTQNGPWLEVVKLAQDWPGRGRHFGAAVALKGDRAVVGATGGWGSAYIFERSPIGAWTQKAMLMASDGRDKHGFGSSVVVDDDRVMIGAAFDDDLGAWSGAVYIFEPDGGGDWVETAKIHGSDTTAEDKFGASLALRGDELVVGAPRNSLVAGGRRESGAVYLLRRDTIRGWVEVGKLVQPDHLGVDSFGDAVAFAAEQVVVGAPYHHTDGERSGAVHVFERICTDRSCMRVEYGEQAIVATAPITSAPSPTWRPSTTTH